MGWLVLRSWSEEGEVPFMEDDWMPKQWQPVAFGEIGWHFDTEVIQGAWVFYNFARSYWAKYRY